MATEPDRHDPRFELFDDAPVPLLVVDDQGRIAFTNQALDTLFEYEPGQLLGRTVEVLVPPEAAAGHPELRQAYTEAPHRRAMGRTQELQAMTRSGTRLAVEVGLNALQVDGCHHMVASVLDVSRLRTEQRKTRMAIDAAANAMVMVDAECRIVLVNRQAVEMFGYGEEELIGAEIELLVPERVRRRHRVYRTGYTIEPEARAMGDENRGLFGRRRDGTEFPVEIGLTPIDDRDQQLVMATIVDITERKRAEAEITWQNNRLVRLNSELTQFAYSASHDLRAPLTTLDGLLRCIQEDLADGDVERALVDSTRAQDLTARLARLIEDVLGFAQAENLDPTMTDVDLPSLVDLLGDDLEALLAENDVELDNRVPPGRTIRTDQRRLTQMLRNLISNGAKFADPDIDERRVAVEVVQLHGQVEIRVVDNGIGIPEANRDQLFTMFRRFRNHDKPGSGLGLALVKKHAEHLDGTVALLDTPEGTTFAIRLPSDEDPATPVGTGEELARTEQP